MKKIIIGLILLILSLGTFSCGGGSGSADSPSGENRGVPSVVQLQPSNFIAQTNTAITLHAKVLDGNGAPVSGKQVTFTNLSPVGVLSATTANTNQSGLATVNLKSTTVGFSTVQAEVSKGVDVDQVRDRKTVFFSPASVSQPAPTLDLAVDGNDADTIPNEFEDTHLFENTNDNEVTVTATVFNGFGLRVAGIAVLFGSDSTEATFPIGNLASTDTNGQASVLVRVVPSTLRSLPTTLNITALADNGAFNMVTLFLKPVIIATINVAANPQSIESGNTSAITAQVLTNAGTPAPDGTTVNFTVSPPSSGGIDPFAQTTDGFAEAQFTAATVTSDTVATVKAAVGAISDTVPITITAPVIPPTPPSALTVNPENATVVGVNNTTAGNCSDADASDNAIFFISGGTPPYIIITTNNPTVIPLCAVTINGGTLTIDPDDVVASTDVIVTVRDSSTPVQVINVTVTVDP